MTSAIATHDPVAKDVADGHDDLFLAVAKVNAKACLGDTGELKPGWRLTEEEIVRIAITVTLVALVTVIGIAAAAILTIR
jgi:hypothetical protein